MNGGRIILEGDGPDGVDAPGAQRIYTITPGSGIDRVLRERERQICGEKLDAEHDDQWIDGELVGAALAYGFSSLASVQPDIDQDDADALIADLWPEEMPPIKRKESDRDLERAAALLLAELDRRDRVREKLAAERARELS